MKKEQKTKDPFVFEGFQLLFNRNGLKKYIFLVVCFMLSLNVGWASTEGDASQFDGSGDVGIYPEQVSQQKIVKGVIVDSNGRPLPGVTVVLKGTTTGTITDLNGHFSLSNVPSEATLVISFIGMKSQEIPVGSQSEIKVVLEEDTIGLEEVVAIGYGTAKKKELTGAVAQVTAEEISKIVTADVSSALQGMVAGVNVTASSGQPGEGSSILIRGISSIYGKNNPLFVVDGVSYEDDPKISPSEIETIDVLKDAASCAIYGSQGAGGVILITTKRGKAGSLNVRFNGGYGVQAIKDGTPLMNSVDQTYADFLQARNVSQTLDSDINLNTLRSNYSFSNESKLEGVVKNDFAPKQSYDLNISGGSKDINYNVTVGYFNQDGIILDAGYDKFNTRFNTNYKNGRWDLSAGVSVVSEKINRAPYSAISYMVRYHPTYPLIDPDNIKPIYAEQDGAIESTNWIMNSFRNEDVTKNVSFNFNLSAKVNLMKGLNFTMKLGASGWNSYRHQFDPFDEVYNSAGDLAKDPVENSSVTMTSYRSSALNWDNILQYQRSFNKHNITIMASTSVQDRRYEMFYGSKAAVLNNNIKSIAGATENPEVGTNLDDNTKRLVGLLGRVMYNYNGKYLFSASVRQDGSSQFGEGHRWGIFPSVSGGWNVSEEEFWNPLMNVVSNLKLRASYGQVGNQWFSPYSFSALIVPNIDYAFGKDESLVVGAAQSSYANADVKWETTVQSNFGVDFGFLNNKITLSAEYYHTAKRDMLMPYQVAPSSGSLPYTNISTNKASSVILNMGDMTNKGVELALGYKFNVGRSNWKMTGTFSTNENIVEKINNLGETIIFDQPVIYEKRADSKVTGLKEGYEAGAFFLYKTNGIIKTEEQLEEYRKLYPSAKYGDLIYVDQNTDGEITDLDRFYAGSGLPEYEVGFNTDVNYEGFDFSMRWYAAIGHEIYNGAKASAYVYNRHQDMVYQYTSVNTGSNIPSYRGLNHPNTKANTDYYLEDGSYLRLKEVTLGYTFPKVFTGKAKIDKLRLYISAQNPLTFTKYEGYDPEVGGGISTRGLDRGNYPVTSLYTVGLNLNF